MELEKKIQDFDHVPRYFRLCRELKFAKIRKRMRPINAFSRSASKTMELLAGVISHINRIHLKVVWDWSY